MHILTHLCHFSLHRFPWTPPIANPPLRQLLSLLVLYQMSQGPITAPPQPGLFPNHGSGGKFGINLPHWSRCFSCFMVFWQPINSCGVLFAAAEALFYTVAGVAWVSGYVGNGSRLLLFILLLFLFSVLLLNPGRWFCGQLPDRRPCYVKVKVKQLFSGLHNGGCTTV